MALGQRDIETNWSRVAPGSSPIHFLHKTRVAISTSWSLFYNVQIFGSCEFFKWKNNVSPWCKNNNFQVRIIRFLNVTNVDARECEYREICNIRFSPNLFLYIILILLKWPHCWWFPQLITISSIHIVCIPTSSSYRLIYSAHFCILNISYYVKPYVLQRKMKTWYYGLQIHKIRNRALEWIIKHLVINSNRLSCTKPWLFGGN